MMEQVSSDPANGTDHDSPTWPAIGPEHPLSQLRQHLPTILKEANHTEIWGLELSLDESGRAYFSTNLVLQKYLRAHANDVQVARDKLLATLKWRKEFKPLDAMKEAHDRQKFAGLGYVTVLNNVPDSLALHSVATFNVYGAVKDNALTFGDVTA